MPSSQGNSSPVYFVPKGLSDSLDPTDDMPGAMAALQNLIFDPSSSGVLQCRPAAIPRLSSKYPRPILGFGDVSVFKIVGDYFYGMASSNANPGTDQPFAFNIVTSTYINVAGFTAANSPATLPSSGAWTPPQMDVVGTKVVFTHLGFAAGTFATATDQIIFSSNPAPGETLTFGSQMTNQASGMPGTLITFVAASPIAADGQVLLGATLAATLVNLLAFLQTSGDANLGALTYAVIGNVLSVAYAQPGADGNSYPISSQFAAATVQTPTLVGGQGYYFGYIDITNPAAPVYGATNTAINPLPAVPSGIQQFNGRAYFIVNPTNGQPGLIPSDPLEPLQRTNGSYVLTFDDNQPLTALAGLPLTNQLGGVVQSLIVFKSAANMYQVTGDPLPDTAAGAWAKNTLNVATGTLAPRSIANSPIGLLFVSPQGLRNIDYYARVSPPIGADGKGVSVPLIQCPIPSRMAAACNAKIYRISLTNAQAQSQEFWYDITKQIWTGPHTLPASMIAPYENTFLLCPIELPPSIYQSDWLQNSASSFVEAGLTLQWAWQTGMLPDFKDMLQHELHETIVKFSSSTGATVQMLDESGDLVQDANGNELGTAQLGPSGVTSNWGNFPSSLYFGQGFAISPIQIPWSTPVVIGRASLQMTGACDSVTRIGAVSMRFEQTGYLPQPAN